MIAQEYEKILNSLAAASGVLRSGQGTFTAADIRIRCLVNITIKEARRALLEIGADPQLRNATQSGPPPVVPGSLPEDPNT